MSRRSPRHSFPRSPSFNGLLRKTIGIVIPDREHRVCPSPDSSPLSRPRAGTPESKSEDCHLKRENKPVSPTDVDRNASCVIS